MPFAHSRNCNLRGRSLRKYRNHPKRQQPRQSPPNPSERPGVDTVYGVVDIPAEFHPELDIEVTRRHIQIQIALAEIGHKLSYRTYIAANDQGVTYKGKPLIALPDVVSNLKEERLLTAYGEAADAARLIDCVWFKNGRLMPAVMEVEHSTGITSGLTRMQKFKNILPPFPSRWVIVGPDEDRAEFIRKSSDSQFKDLDARWFPYSAVEELHNLVHRRVIKGVTEEFLDSFIEKAA
jgi:type II restriction enzyme